MHPAELPKPAPGDGQVLLKLAYSGVNPVDWKLREGYLKDVLPHRFPLILGWEGAGEVVELGAGVSAWKLGDAVFTYCSKPEVQHGTYAEYVAVDAGAVAAIPKSLELKQAAAIPLVTLTAWQALFEFAQLQTGQSVLVHAGAGGVGRMAIQLARHKGATVYTTASAANQAESPIGWFFLPSNRAHNRPKPAT